MIPVYKKDHLTTTTPPCDVGGWFAPDRSEELLKKRLTPPHSIIYEQPLNERVRTFLRLDDLFAQTRHSLVGRTVWDSRATLASLLEILSIFERGDLKAEVLKELERHNNNLSRLQDSPNVDTNRLNDVLQQLTNHTQRLHQQITRIGQRLRDVDLLITVRQRLVIPGGTCNFDLPVYHYWLQQPPEKRMADLYDWLGEFEMIEQAISLILELTRHSGMPSNELAQAGFFQRPLESQTPYQLIRVSVSTDHEVFPEVSAGRHRISLRFLNVLPGVRPTQTTANIPFTLSCCVI